MIYDSVLDFWNEIKFKTFLRQFVSTTEIINFKIYVCRLTLDRFVHSYGVFETE